MIRQLKRAAALVIAVLIGLSAPATPALTQEFVKAVPVSVPVSVPFAASAAVGASAIAPLSPALAPGISAAPAPLAAPAAVEAAQAPPAAVIDADSGARPGGVKTWSSKLLRTAARIAEAFAPDKASDGELPPPPDAVDSLARTPLDVDPARAYRASPSDWRDETLYSVLLDRFAKGDGAKPYGNPKDGLSRHGGNIRGVIDKLDYIKESGVTTILLSPVTMTVPEAYHGYAPVHFLAVDPHLGTMADFKELVAKAHAKGLRVVLDWVVNHAGPVFEYADGKTQWTGDDKPGPIEWTRTLKPVEFTKDDFSRERVITDWNDRAQAIKGDFPPNYRHFATDRPGTQDKLIRIAQWWMKETDIDGLRLDAVRHLAPGFLPRFSKEIRSYAAKLGKNNFLMLGENSTGIDGELKPFLENGSLDTLYDYPAFRRENAVLHGQGPTRTLENSRRTSQSALGGASGRLTRFIDLHDTYRFLLSDTPGGLLKTALAYLMTAAGIPLVYYGTEQAFRQLHGRLTPEGGDLPADPQNREDMFGSGRYKSASSAGDKFDAGSESFKFLRALADLRKAYPALTRGAQYERWSDPNGPGLYAFSRIYNDQEVLVVLNTAAEKRGAEMWVDSGLTPAGTALEDALNPGYRIAARAEGGGSKVSVEVPPYGARVLVRPAPGT